MKLLKTLILLSILLMSATFYAQNRAITKTSSLKEGTIDNQFEYLIKKSNRYQEFKVVKRAWLDQLRKSVNDSLVSTRKNLNTNLNIIKEKQQKINELTNSLNASNSKVTRLNNEKDSISFFGNLISKPLYNTILWSIICLLLLALITYIIRFNRSNTITKEVKENLVDLENEYEGYRQRSLEREQQIRRKLQDEINKQRKD